MKTDRLVIVSQYIKEFIRIEKESGTKIFKVSMKKYKKKAEVEVRGHENFLALLAKLNERLTIIQLAIQDGLDLSEGDTLVLHEVFKLWDEDRLHWLTKDVAEQESHIQQQLFKEEDDDDDEELSE